MEQILLATERRENIEQVEGHHPTQQGTGGLSVGEAGGVAQEVGQGERQETMMEGKGDGILDTQTSRNTPPPPPPHTLTESSLAPPSKIILIGQKSKTLHKEELTVSETERKMKKRIEENAK